MLEKHLSSAQATLNAINRFFWLAWAVMFFIVFQFVHTPGESMLFPIGAGVVIGAIAFFWMKAKYALQIRFLRPYLDALRGGNMAMALEAGRQYYSVLRKGLGGVDGSGLTIYDEQAIANDLRAYSMA